MSAKNLEWGKCKVLDAEEVRQRPKIQKIRNQNPSGGAQNPKPRFFMSAPILWFRGYPHKHTSVRSRRICNNKEKFKQE